MVFTSVLISTIFLFLVHIFSPISLDTLSVVLYTLMTSECFATLNSAISCFWLPVPHDVIFD